MSAAMVRCGDVGLSAVPVRDQLACEADRRVRLLAHSLERAGWELLSLEMDLSMGRARIEVRGFNGKLVTFDADNFRRFGRRASLTIETQRTQAVAVGRRGDRFRADQIKVDFVRRDWFEGARSGLRGLCTYLIDNAPHAGALTQGDVRGAVGAVLDIATQQLVKVGGS